ncbi:Arm DNA-binding domain-containing protein [Mucilaginibacter polytrichastri]|uniref:Arm DNA-binding domain-containing protein n=1 Tax=Mucilaginibacter polytrichastri TaxID=1302689 RepID=A0A1Q5ZSR4_9SPHI|nr:Arm DNA-binding domain-containing protein [Mucilaginibacter polytrichastri]OKS84806.1 hypothetical protein RG47T_0241 [Mucilaginibacter polytrichastri]SFT00041.1 hypothetical protein SAMN04487890_1081 [Mucilaginibacter polytrichastri]
MKNHQKLTLLFWHRKSKADAKGNAPIICRISIEGEIFEELAIGKKVHLKNWDVEYKKTKGGSQEKATNQKINEISVDLNRQFIFLQAEYERVTPLKWRF